MGGTPQPLPTALLTANDQTPLPTDTPLPAPDNQHVPSSSDPPIPPPPRQPPSPIPLRYNHQPPQIPAQYHYSNPFQNAPPQIPQNFYHNNHPNFQYAYLPMHHNSSNSNIPNTSHIQELKSRADWVAWYQETENIITAKGLLNHICDPPLPNVMWTALNAPLYPPVLPQEYTHAHINKWKTWYHKDAIVFGILMARLSREILSMIPSIQDPTTGTQRTA
ncbi:uncharacterized protein ARMOST_11698 [Armillaria ostoyae]|uniref:Uncharacterized protein n=1 Tax=Armillaria ostoyae TaxID=47428 RepID=A0A284RHV1_ARMOS|nr:uncharacterized protein ARMOST_11698 [Armillaria ostoyae]